MLKKIRDQVYKECLSSALVADPTAKQSTIEARAMRLTDQFMTAYAKDPNVNECIKIMDRFYSKGQSEEQKKKIDFSRQIAAKKTSSDELFDPEEQGLTHFQKAKEAVDSSEAVSEMIFQQSCKVCNAENDPPTTVLKTCSTCKKIWYCSKEHQKSDWPRHKKTDCISSKSAS